MLESLSTLSRALLGEKRRRRIRNPLVWGTLRRTQPFCGQYGYSRGIPVDRYYIERFLARHGSDVRGRVLEVKDRTYTERFGSGVEHSDVLDIDAGNTLATIVTDLARAEAVPADQFDCIVLTQTLQLIYDVESAVRHCRRLLRPGGVLLVTVPVTSRIVPGDGITYDFWRFTAASCTRLFGDIFGPEGVSVETAGNVLTSIAFLAGVAAEELRESELQVDDPYFPLVVTVRAVKGA